MEFSVVVLLVIGLNVCESKFGLWEAFKNKGKFIDSIDIVYHCPFMQRDISIQNMSDSFSRFDSRLPVKLLIHGWQGGLNDVALEPIKNAYLDKGGVNLFSADWSMAAMQNYYLSRFFVSKAAKQIGQLFATFLIQMNISFDQVHILGHSLGAHIAGKVGQYFNSQINRITGLDPAGSLFRRKSRDAISSNDARFVDSIHTDTGVLGEVRPRAHVDFYPNQGIHPQPGCGSLDDSSCSHNRASIYYAETIMRPNNFLARPCDCHSLSTRIKIFRPHHNLNKPRRQVYMGEHCPYSARGMYCLETNSYPPYGRGN